MLMRGYRIMKVVITGSTGFVGRHLVKKCVDIGFSVLAVRTSDRDNINLHGYMGGAEILRISNLSELRSDFFNDTTLIHCAWENVHETQDISHFDHATEQISFLNSVAKTAIKKVIITGTCYEYGLTYGPVSIHQKTNPNTPYAIAKNFVREAATSIFAQRNIPLTWARLFYLYGAGQNTASIYSQLSSAIERGDEVFNMSFGEQLYDYMAVEDVAEKLSQLIQHSSPALMNLGCGRPISLRRLVESIIADRGSNIQPNFGLYPYRSQDSLAIWAEKSFDEQLQL